MFEVRFTSGSMAKAEAHEITFLPIGVLFHRDDYDKVSFHPWSSVRAVETDDKSWSPGVDKTTYML